MNTNIGQNIKKLRNANRMTQEELANRANITKSTVSAYESCTRLPSYDVLIKIANIFHVSTDNLLGFSSQYTVDITDLNINQRCLVNEIVDLCKFKNNATLKTLTSESSCFEMDDIDIKE